MIGIEPNESDAIVIAFLLVIPAFFVDRAVARQREHEAQLQAEQLRVLRVTRRTVQDIVNNDLNQRQLEERALRWVVPRGERRAAAWLEHPADFGKRPLGVWTEHQPVRVGHGIERCICEPQLLRVARRHRVPWRAPGPEERRA